MLKDSYVVHLRTLFVSRCSEKGRSEKLQDSCTSASLLMWDLSFSSFCGAVGEPGAHFCACQADAGFPSYVPALQLLKSCPCIATFVAVWRASCGSRTCCMPPSSGLSGSVDPQSRHSQTPEGHARRCFLYLLQKEQGMHLVLVVQRCPRICRNLYLKALLVVHFLLSSALFPLLCFCLHQVLFLFSSFMLENQLGLFSHFCLSLVFMVPKLKPGASHARQVLCH